MRVYLVDDTRARVLVSTRDEAHQIARNGYFPPGAPTGEATSYPVNFIRDEVQVTEIDLSTSKDFLVRLINEGPDLLAAGHPVALPIRTWELTPRGGLKLIEDHRGEP